MVCEGRPPTTACCLRPKESRGWSACADHDHFFWGGFVEFVATAREVTAGGLRLWALRDRRPLHHFPFYQFPLSWSAKADHPRLFPWSQTATSRGWSAFADHDHFFWAGGLGVHLHSVWTESLPVCVSTRTTKGSLSLSGMGGRSPTKARTFSPGRICFRLKR